MKSFILFVFVCNLLYTNGFNVGVRGTVCSLDEKNYNDPCDSLYGAICDGAHCKCPPGTTENKSLKTCEKGGPPSDFDDLPFDYIPNGSPTKETTRRTTTTTTMRPRQPASANAGSQSDSNNIAEKTGGGIGGGLGLIALLGLIYFCCCKGDKSKNLLSKLPFGRSRGTNLNDPGSQPMQESEGQQMYVQQEEK